MKLVPMSVVVCFLLLFSSGFARALSENSIKQQIEEKVSETPGLSEANEVHVYVEGGVVVLLGTVRFYEQKMAYHKIAWQTTGVVEVENEIRVIPRFPVPDKIIDRKVRKIIKTYKRLQPLQLVVTVNQGSVSIEGSFIHPSNVLFLKHKAAVIDGVVAIEIRATLKV